MMQVSAFDFDLPEALIAQAPARPRDRARLLHVDGSKFDVDGSKFDVDGPKFDIEGGGLGDHVMRDLPGLLRAGDLLVFNDTKVLPARLRAKRGEASIEIMLHQPDGRGGWSAFAKPARKCRPGDWLQVAPGFGATVIERGEGGEVHLGFEMADDVLFERLREHGEVPLPPYIKRSKGGAQEDHEDYQTLFARHEGAVAAPTASLHFTPALMEGLAAVGVNHAFVTLHVGAGTFLPVKTEETGDHKMHGERYALGEETVASIECTRKAGGRVIAVGTTVLRTLEAVAAARGGRLVAMAGETDLFITPGFRFRVVDRLLTNFHLPRSTLFMLIAAFAGLEPVRAAYAHAIRQGYRFYSYGDGCLLTPKRPRLEGDLP